MSQLLDSWRLRGSQAERRRISAGYPPDSPLVYQADGGGGQGLWLGGLFSVSCLKMQWGGQRLHVLDCKPNMARCVRAGKPRPEGSQGPTHTVLPHQDETSTLIG
ncbi:unnamed protein product [Gadus morhua 'NCC']